MIRRATIGTWCDYCKDQWGMINNKWNDKAKTPAWVAIVSERPLAKGIVRNYCMAHAEALTLDVNGLPFPFDQQISYIREANVYHV